MCFVSTALDKGNFFAPCSCAITKCGCSEEEKAKRKNEATLSARIISNRKINVSNNSKGKSIICTYIGILKYWNIILLVPSMHWIFLDDYCKSNIPGSNKNCLTRAEVGKSSARMVDGDPCFSPVENEGVSFDYN